MIRFWWKEMLLTNFKFICIGWNFRKLNDRLYLLQSVRMTSHLIVDGDRSDYASKAIRRALTGIETVIMINLVKLAVRI